uniref:Uncharacterized protein n=1 Tax=Candidatus Kentrum sp. TUN TaxID=2126343 RepID=A0A450Z8X6_9GAMM|nr:MAG: hypothetical protein BECKTUN1418E_GA0071001_100155 [Candidatus Kentron sp. TUN]VFK50787.1 MAG: hypothetical protein BECKTUN1418D_GA0071000_10028 [Candidatus Kentron sp. TUN]VFK51292.1 MAG: hypothetical protein BECKTUN1418F_GA0071002_100155 [Candidatus Kentron sp. TUN]
MPLFIADTHLTRARLFGRVGEGRGDDTGYPWESPQADFGEAWRLIDKHGYHCRDGELDDAESVLLAS